MNKSTDSERLSYDPSHKEHLQIDEKRENNFKESPA